jgi:hypothetical protein
MEPKLWTWHGLRADEIRLAQQSLISPVEKTPISSGIASMVPRVPAQIIVTYQVPGRTAAMHCCSSSVGPQASNAKSATRFIGRRCLSHLGYVSRLDGVHAAVLRYRLDPPPIIRVPQRPISRRRASRRSHASIKDGMARKKSLFAIPGLGAARPPSGRRRGFRSI